MAIDVNGFGMGGASGGAPSKFYFERYDAGSAGVISNISSTANNTPSKSVMTNLLHLNGPGVLHNLAVYGNGVYKEPGGDNYDEYSDITRANSQARLIIEKDNETIMRCGCYLVRRWGGGLYSYPLVIGSEIGSGSNSQRMSYVFVEEPTITNNVLNVGNSLTLSKSGDSGSGIHMLYENANELITDGVLNMRGIYYPRGIYFEDSIDVYACFGNPRSSGTYTGGNGIWVLYELYD